MSSNRCPQCGGEGTIINDNGRRICSACGLILQEQALVNELSFIDNAHGAATVSGQFVPSSGMSGMGGGVSTQTVTEGLNKIDAICDNLPKLSQDAVELAHRIYQIAVKHRFTRGRTIEIVSAAAVYVAIRVNRSSGYLLDDVAEHVSCGIYELAATALRLAHAVNQPLPTIDPVLYITRFLEELNLGRNLKAVHDTAIHIVHRLDRDWIQTGRKPSGIVGTAIMIACQIHHIPISKERIKEIARVCTSTINKRLKEISETELARESIDQLRLSESILDDDSHELPPIMKRSKNKNLLDEIAEEVKGEKQEQEDQNFDDEDFEDPELESIDQEILTPEESEKKLTLYMAMFKSHFNAPPKEPKQKRHRKKKQTSTYQDSDTVYVQDNGMLIADNDEIAGDDDNFEDIVED